MTISVNGTPCRSSSGAPSIWYFTSCRPFCRCSKRASYCGGTSWSSGKVTLRLLPAGGTRTGISPSSSSSGASVSLGWATRGGAATGTCSRRATATTCWIALSKACDSSSWRCPKKCSDGRVSHRVPNSRRERCRREGSRGGACPSRERGRSCYHLQGLSADGECCPLLLICCLVRIFHMNSSL
ncbi:UNVERIFIED_CONTAM: hypothetical protein Sradi_6233400 [Sesamum radiatum]|uniref:Uncharacterized protein n=1 Tax=Sesamum radiatum TaxID=300843 RepID=A0AAW2KCS7_SESRA